MKKRQCDRLRSGSWPPRRTFPKNADTSDFGGFYALDGSYASRDPERQATEINIELCGPVDPARRSECGPGAASGPELTVWAASCSSSRRRTRPRLADHNVNISSRMPFWDHLSGSAAK